ncbi:UNVERIFIED_CONTAM: Serine carboxypeptidase-like 18 [Sesamum calycinum]|uniref:Serine carboxypeptidase-like 18 n=1 Tax=Sesamum calycinum TaxID=2727403 RepID=A0AAW2RUQ3_9LAMI
MELPSLKLLVFLLIILWSSRTVLPQHVVETLPGLPDKLPNKLETGYVGVGEDEKVQLFYYFFESESNPEEDPFILWLTGGPGCSGLSTILMEIGTFVIDYPNCKGGQTALKLNEYAWTKSASILFIDQPVGTGYSYSNTLEGYITNDTLSTRICYDFLRKWLIKHPQYLKNPLYILGESYSGITLPLIVNEVYKGLQAGDKPTLNMKGYALGNPVTDIYQDNNERIPLTIAGAGFQSAKANCHGNYINGDSMNILCVNDLRKIKQCLDKIYLPQILEPWCEEALWTPKRHDIMSLYASSVEEMTIDFIQPVVARKEKEWCREDNVFLTYLWANDKAVQKALNVPEYAQGDYELTYATIKGSGHTNAEFKPKESFAMLDRWIRGSDL